MSTFTRESVWHNSTAGDIIPHPTTSKAITLPVAGKFVDKNINIKVEPMSSGTKAVVRASATWDSPKFIINEAGGTLKNQTAYGVTSTKPSGTDGTNYFSISSNGNYEATPYTLSYSWSCATAGYQRTTEAGENISSGVISVSKENNFTTLYIPKASVTVNNPTVSGESVTTTPTNVTLTTTANDTDICFNAKYVGTVAKASASWTSGLIKSGNGQSANGIDLSKEQTYYITAMTVSKGTFNKVSLTGGTLVFNDGITDWHWNRNGNTVTVY